MTIELAPLRWQQAPKEVSSVWVGPDGRTWYQLAGNVHLAPTPQLRASLEREYLQAAPQISAATLALIEPSGWVWFSVNLGRTLWGYDGEKWVEREAPAKSAFVGTCPTRGALLDNACNRSIGGKAWFRDRQGVHVFDGKEWSYEPLCEPSILPDQQPRFAVSPNGELAVALRRKRVQNEKDTVHEVWAYQNGKWRQLEGLVVPGARGNVSSFCISNEGVIYYTWNSVSLRTLVLNEKQLTADLIAQLGHESFQVREDVMQKLAARGTALKADLESALKATTDPEIKFRLGTVLQNLDGRPRPADRFATIGACRIRDAAAIFQHVDGSVYIFAEEVVRPGAPSVRGLAVLKPGGAVQSCALDDGLVGMHAIALNAPTPIEEFDRSAIWLPQYNYGPLARRVDLNSGKVTAESPDAHFSHIHAVDGNGNVYLSQQARNALGLSTSRLGVLRPAIPDSRPALSVSTAETARGDWLVASDGAVWAQRAEGLVRFDGREWKAVGGDKSQAARLMLHGLQGVVAAATKRTVYLLFQRDQLLGEGTWQELILQHRGIITAAFPHTYTQLATESTGVQIATDANGNVWLREKARVSVLVGDKWLDATEKLKEAGSKFGNTAFMAAVGDGREIYLSDLMLLHDHGKSFLAHIEDGQLQLREAPHASRETQLPQAIRDGEGGLWLPRNIAESAGTSDTIKGQCSTRLAVGKPPQDISDYWPLLADRAGNVWLTKLRPQRRSEFKIWRNGSIVQELEIQGTDIVYGLISDKPDSVFAWTALGMQHLVASEAGNNYHYELKTTYALPAVPVPMFKSAYSDLGYWVAATSTGPAQHIYFFQLPK